MIKVKDSTAVEIHSNTSKPAMHGLLKCNVLTLLASVSLKLPNRWQSEETKSSLYGGCGSTSQLFLENTSDVRRAV
jgi:hypothetical protein